MPASPFSWWCDYRLSQDTSPAVRAVAQPPQYAVFDRFASSVLFNFNNDNLADRIDPRHVQLRPHGAIPASRWRPRPVLVVDPYPDRVADTIASAVHRNVSVLRCKWNVLAEFILAGHYHLACQASHTKGLQALTSMYQQFEDALDERGLVRDL